MQKDSQVQPTLVTNSVGQDTTDSDSDNVRAGVNELSRRLGQVLCSLNNLHGLIKRHGGNHRIVRNARPVIEVTNLGGSFNAHNLFVERKLVLGQSLGDSLPNSSRTIIGRESESRVRTPIDQQMYQYTSC